MIFELKKRCFIYITKNSSMRISFNFHNKRTIYPCFVILKAEAMLSITTVLVFIMNIPE